MNERACEQAREQLHEQARGSLPEAEAKALEAHLAGCDACSRALDEERVLSELLRTRLTPQRAPAALRQKLSERAARAVTGAPREPDVPRRPEPLPLTAAKRPRRGVWTGLWGLSVAAAVALGFLAHGAAGPSPVPREALNDHLRVLYAQDPVEIPNGGLHQVKPWFTGRVDFAPDIAFAGDADFPLVGGAVGYFLDRKAASFVWKRRLHTITLHVFRADGLDWPRAETRRVGQTPVQLVTMDGFHIVLWRAQGLGHALVSDVSTEELLSLTARLLP